MSEDLDGLFPSSFGAHNILSLLEWFYFLSTLANVSWLWHSQHLWDLQHHPGLYVGPSPATYLASVALLNRGVIFHNPFDLHIFHDSTDRVIQRILPDSSTSPEWGRTPLQTTFVAALSCCLLLFRSRRFLRSFLSTYWKLSSYGNPPLFISTHTRPPLDLFISFNKALALALNFLLFFFFNL